MDNTLEVIKEHLVPYLAKHGVDVGSKMFRCFSGLHEDNDPSCNIVPASKGKSFHCFSCAQNGDVFTAAHLIEGLPKEGPDFWKLTVPSVAKQVGIEYTAEELSPADRERYQLLAAHRDAADIILSSIDRESSVVHKYAKTRGWTTDTLRECGVGAVDSFSDYMKTMRSLGWSEEYLKKAGLSDALFFRPESLLFILRDGNGRPIGFACRDMEWNEGCKHRKYLNSAESPIYTKSSTLYLFDKCVDEEGPLWIVEGYADAVTLRQAGLKRVCAIGGIYFTGPDEMHPTGSNHLDVLIDHDISSVVLALDGDDAGKRGISRALTEHFTKTPTIMVRVCPLDKVDPDDIVREKGLEELTSIPLLSPFAWKLSGISHTADPRQVVEEMVPIILQESSSITKWEMCRDLAAKTSIPITTITDEVASRSSTDRDEAKRKVSGIVRDLQKRLAGSRDPEVTVSLIQDAGERMAKIMEDGTIKRPSFEERVASIRNAVMDTTLSRRIGLGKYKQLESAMRGFPTEAQLMVIAGNPSCGKSSLLRNISWEIMRNNEKSHIIYMSLDDSFQRTLQGYVSLYTQVDQEDIVDKKVLAENAAKREALWTGFDHIMKLGDRLVIRDMCDGDTIPAIEREINTALRKHTGKDVFLILDSFNKLVEVSSGLDEPGKVAEACDRIKKIVNKYNVPILMNVEFRKTDWITRPTLRDLKGTMAIEYDADLAMIIHQPLHQDKDTRMVWHPGNGRRPMPINELQIVKNKITGYEGSIFLKFLTSRSRLDEMPEAAAIPLMEEEKKRLSDKWRKMSNDKRKTGWDKGGASEATGTDVERPGGEAS